MTKTRLYAALTIAFGGSIVATSSLAQQQLERVEITGSAIKRIDAETAVPVTVLKVDDLKKEGVTTIEQVMERISAAQINQGTSQSVGLGTGGASFAEPARSGPEQDAGPAQRPAPREQRDRQLRARPEHDPVRRDRAGGGAARRRLGAVRHRRGRRRDQLHHRSAISPAASSPPAPTSRASGGKSYNGNVGVRRRRPAEGPLQCLRRPRLSEAGPTARLRPTGPAAAAKTSSVTFPGKYNQDGQIDIRSIRAAARPTEFRSRARGRTTTPAAISLPAMST